MVLASALATTTECFTKSLRPPYGILQIGFQKQIKTKQRKQSTFNYKQHLDINSKTPSSVLCLYKDNYRKAVKQNAEQKVFKTPLWKLQSGLQKAKKPTGNREWSTLH